MQPPCVKNDGKNPCLRCGAVILSKRRRKYCSQKCMLKMAAVPARPLYRNRHDRSMELTRKRDKRKMDAAKKALLKARARARDAERNLKAAQRALDKSKRMADKNIARAKADAMKAKKATMSKRATPKKTANVPHAVMSRSISVRALNPKGKRERLKRAAGASTVAMGIPAEVKSEIPPKHKGKNGGREPCGVCGKAITGRRRQKYCSDKCLHEKNSERVRLRNKNHPEKIREYDKKWRQNNPEKARESTRRWRKNNLKKASEHSQRQVEKKAKMPSKPPGTEKKAIWKKTPMAHANNEKKAPTLAKAAINTRITPPPKSGQSLVDTKATIEPRPGVVASESSKAGRPHSVQRSMTRYLVTLTFLYYTQYMIVETADPASAVNIARASVPYDWDMRDTSMLRVYEAPRTASPAGKWLQITNTLEMHIEQRTAMCSRKVGMY